MGLSARHLSVIAGLSLAVCLALAGFAAPSLASGSRHAGHRTGAVSAAEIAAAVKQETGLEPSQVEAKRVCGNASAGTATCFAEVLVSRATGKVVRAKVARENLMAQSKASGARSAASSSSTKSAAIATSEPIAGTPGWIQEAYDLTWLSAHKGSGTVIAVVDADDDPAALSDMMKFRSEFGLPACNGSSANTTASNYSGCFERVSQIGSTTSYPASPSGQCDIAHPSIVCGWVSEESLDLDAVSTTCPLCTIDLVEANSDADDDFNTAIAEAHKLGAKIISLSLGGPDYYSNFTSEAEVNTFSGVSTLAAAGDDGTAGTASSLDSDGSSLEQFPAALPGVTAVGGTSLANATGIARGFAESVWNDEYGATGSGCATDVPTPSWQSSSVTDCVGRAYNDVSVDADPATGLDTYDSYISTPTLVAGGTSLATPLLAGYEAVTGIGLSSSNTTVNSDGSFSGQWAYHDIADLNDITAGDNYANTTEQNLCKAAIICNAGTGWDGPTGNGSISGQIVSGGPGIGGAYVTSTTSSASGSDASNISATGATLTTGIYPNGLDTTVSWQYGTSASFGQTTATADAGSGTDAQTVTGTLTCLTPSTTYYYRPVAINSDGTTDGYTYSFTTASGSADSSCGSTGTGTTTTGTGTTTTGTGTGTTGTGTTTTGTGTTAPAPIVVAPAKLSGTAKVGSRLKVNGGSFENVTSVQVVLQRCFASCVTIAGGGSGYKLTKADAGAYLRAYEVLTGNGGSVLAAVNGLIGPVRSGTTNSVVVKVGTVNVKVGANTLRIQGTIVRGKLVLQLALTRGRARSLRVWVFTVKGNTLLRFSRAAKLNGTMKLKRSSGARYVLVLHKV